MAVSIWIGGLFYISSVLVTAIRSRATITSTRASTFTDKVTEETSHPLSDSEKIPSIILYYLALLLPRFSLLATISLGVIGVSGLYMAWIQLHSLNALFSSLYGNILIIKLSAALPVVLLGAYHQLRLHRSVVLLASIGRGRRGDAGSSTPISQTFSNNYGGEINNKNNNNSVKDKGKIKAIPSKFSKTIKIESLVAMSVLLA